MLRHSAFEERQDTFNGQAPQVAFEQQCLVRLAAGQRTGQVGCHRTFAFLRNRAGNQNLFQRPGLPQLP